jgi:hypothetical protein
MSELKPCPFCGGEAFEEQFHHGAWWIRCRNAGCFVRPATDLTTKERSEWIWNRRSDDE